MMFSFWNIVFSLLKIFSLLPLWPTSDSAFMYFFKSKGLFLAHLPWMLLSLIQECFISLWSSLGVNYMDGQMWACWQWLFSRQSDRTSFENFLNHLEDSETTSGVVKDPIVTQQASLALIRFFRVSSFDLTYLCKHRCSHREDSRVKRRWVGPKSFDETWRSGSEGSVGTEGWQAGSHSMSAMLEARATSERAKRRVADVTTLIRLH